MMSLENLLKLNRFHLERREESRRIIISLNSKVTIQPYGTRGFICDDYPLRTLRMLFNGYNNQETANAIYEWMAWSTTVANEDETRELIAFGVPYAGKIGKRMLMFAIKQTKAAHSRFLNADLSDMDAEDAAAFKTVFSVLANVYLQRRSSFWKSMEDYSGTDWDDWTNARIPSRDQATKAFPVANEELVSLIIAHTDRADDIERYIITRGIDVASKDISMLKLYLESDAIALSGGFL